MFVAQMLLNILYIIGPVKTIDTFEETDSVDQHVACSGGSRHELFAEAAVKLVRVTYGQMAYERFHDKETLIAVCKDERKLYNF